MAAWAVTPLIVSHQVSTGAKLWCGVFVTDRNNDVLALSQKKRRHTVCSLSKVPRVLRKTIKQKLNIPQCLSVTCTYVFFFSLLSQTWPQLVHQFWPWEWRAAQQLCFVSFVCSLQFSSQYWIWALCLNGTLKWDEAVFPNRALSDADTLARH